MYACLCVYIIMCDTTNILLYTYLNTLLCVSVCTCKCSDEHILVQFYD